MALCKLQLILALVIILVLEIWASPQLGTARTAPDPDDDALMSHKHEKWMSEFGQSYKDDEEKAMRLEIFKKNVKYIESFNEKGDMPYKLGVNKFTDLTNEEFQATYLSFNGGYNNNMRSRLNTSSDQVSSFRYANVSNSSVPDSVDWRQRGAVTNVTNQGRCGACWAFSAVAAVESINKIKTGNLVKLSEQQIIDCTVVSGTGGCGGGLMDYAYEFIVSNSGLALNQSYPYKATKDTCNNQSWHGVKINGFVHVPHYDESALLAAVTRQPVSVAIDASSFHFRFYTNGVFKGVYCGSSPNHAVTVVGYGLDNGIKYWLVKNSWGTLWGDKGYMKIERDFHRREGACAITMFASYPTIITN